MRLQYGAFVYTVICALFCYLDVLSVLVNVWNLFILGCFNNPSANEVHLWPILLTLFNLNHSMDT